MKTKPRTILQGMEAIANNLREFGYPEVTPVMIRETYNAWKNDPEGKLPHGIIGKMARAQFEEHSDFLASLA